jgi:hypothetical protein
VSREVPLVGQATTPDVASAHATCTTTWEPVTYWPPSTGIRTVAVGATVSTLTVTLWATSSPAALRARKWTTVSPWASTVRLAEAPATVVSAMGSAPVAE